MVTVKFYQISVNLTDAAREIIFPYEGKWYRMDWENVPDKFKQLYVAYCKLNGVEIPDFLKPYDIGTFDISTTDIELDLTLAEEIPETYPSR